MMNIKQKLKNSSLYCFTPDGYSFQETIDIVKQEIAGGCDIIQLREKKITDREKLELAIKIRKITLNKNVLFIVNNDLDIALLSNADGIHLGWDDIPVEHARKMLKNKIIGLSSINEEQYIKAQEKDADYIAIGPVFPTRTKVYDSPVITLLELTSLMKKKKKFTVAIGGIRLDNIEQLSGLNIDSFAVISDIIKARSIKKQTGELKKKINEIKSNFLTKKYFKYN